MKRRIRLSGCACIGGALTFALAAQGEGPFVKAEAGPTITEDVTITEFLSLAPGSKIEFDPGFRFAFGGGYSFSDFIAIGGETGFSYNTIDNIQGASSESDSSIGNVPLMGNIILKFPNQSRLVPYAGAGAGVSFVWFDAHTIQVPTGGGGFDTVDGSDSDAVFAWQVFGGLKYEINPNMSLGLGYKYLHADSPEWNAEDDFGTEISFRTGHIETHAVTFVFNMKF
jgi:opacity protein-like surface antigen